jgi:hypothetical protein
LRVTGGKIDAQGVGIQAWLKRRFRQQARHVGSRGGIGKLLGNAVAIQHVG